MVARTFNDKVVERGGALIHLFKHKISSLLPDESAKMHTRPEGKEGRLNFAN